MPSNILTSLWVLFLLTPIAWGAGTADDFTFYRVQSRPAEELVQLAEGLQGPNVRLRAFDEKIVIRGPKNEVDALLRLFGELDRRARNYRVQVRAVAVSASSYDARAVEGAIRSKQVQVGARSAVLEREGGGVTVNGGTSGGRLAGDVRAGVQSGDVEAQSGAQQVVVVTEGREGAIQASSGLFPTAVKVKLRSLGDRGVHLDLRQQQAQGQQVQSLVSEIDLPLGQWRFVGSISQQDEARSGEILGSASSRSQARKNIQVRVDLEAN